MSLFSNSPEASGQQRPGGPARPKPAPLLEAAKLDGPRSQKDAQGASYRVTEPPAAKDDDRRSLRRKRTRLRAGKILDRDNRFLVECQIRDRSMFGAQLRPIEPVILPRLIRFYDDEKATLIEAEVVWRQNGEIGVQFGPKVNSRLMSAAQLAGLAGKYYAVR